MLQSCVEVAIPRRRSENISATAELGLGRVLGFCNGPVSSAGETPGFEVECGVEELGIPASVNLQYR